MYDRHVNFETESSEEKEEKSNTHKETMTLLRALRRARIQKESSKVITSGNEVCRFLFGC